MSLTRAMKALSTMSMAMLISSAGPAFAKSNDDAFEPMGGLSKSAKHEKADSNVASKDTKNIENKKT